MTEWLRALKLSDPTHLAMGAALSEIKNEFIQNIVYVLITCKFKKYQMNSNQKHALMHFPITRKYKKEWIENNQEQVETPLSTS